MECIASSEYTGARSDGHTAGSGGTGRRHHGGGTRGSTSVSSHRGPSSDLPLAGSTAQGGGSTPGGPTDPTLAGDDGSVSDSAMLFGQLSLDERRRHKMDNNTLGGKSSTAGGTASSKTGSGN